MTQTFGRWLAPSYESEVEKRVYNYRNKKNKKVFCFLFSVECLDTNPSHKKEQKLTNHQAKDRNRAELKVCHFHRLSKPTTTSAVSFMLWCLWFFRLFELSDAHGHHLSLYGNCRHHIWSVTTQRTSKATRQHTHLRQERKREAGRPWAGIVTHSSYLKIFCILLTKQNVLVMRPH